jgi:hypothetical protein
LGLLVRADDDGTPVLAEVLAAAALCALAWPAAELPAAPA